MDKKLFIPLLIIACGFVYVSSAPIPIGNEDTRVIGLVTLVLLAFAITIILLVTWCDERDKDG
jgi:hypothetical protein